MYFHYHTCTMSMYTLLCRKLFKAFIIILPLLGVTWVIGLLAVNEDTVAFATVFVILNSLQVIHGIVCYTLFISDRSVLNVHSRMHALISFLQGTAIFFFFVVRSDQVWPKIVSLCKFCCSRKPSKIATTNRLSPPCAPISVSLFPRWHTLIV